MTNPVKPTSVLEQLGNNQGPQPNVEVTPSVSEVIKSASGDVTKLLELMIIKEGREAAREQQQLERLKAVTAQRERNARFTDAKLIAKQATCRHIKGEKHRQKGPNQIIDYNLSSHRFIDGTSVIKCLTCGAKWRPEDTAEFRYFKGKKVVNHTHLGWLEVSRLFEHQSSNKASSSESILVVTSASPNASSIAEKVVDSQGRVVANSIVDTEGKPVTIEL
jgi:hypothetical protein